MCTYSMVMDYAEHNNPWNSGLSKQHLDWIDSLNKMNQQVVKKPPTKADIDNYIKELKDLIEQAKQFNEKTGQKDCELESKKDKLRKISKELNDLIDTL